MLDANAEDLADGAKIGILNYAHKHLFPEASGILAWIGRGYLLFLQDEAATGTIVFPAAMKSWKQQWVTEVDPIHAFFKECVVKSTGTATPSHELHTGYQKWCVAHHQTSNDNTCGPVGYRSNHVFGQRITKLHAPAKHTRSGSVYDKKTGCASTTTTTLTQTLEPL